MFKKNVAIICLMFFSYSQINAMDDPDFQEYLRTGRNADGLMAMDSLTKGFNILEAKLPAADLDKTISNPAYAAQLEKLPSSEIVERYTLYRTVHNTFLSTLFLQQEIAKRLNESNAPEELTKLESFSQMLQERRTKTSVWLTAIRKSGEEHYLGVSKLNIGGEPRSRKDFWQSTLKPVVLAKLEKLYRAEIYLSPAYMAILREQLDSELE